MEFSQPQSQSVIAPHPSRPRWSPDCGTLCIEHRGHSVPRAPGGCELVENPAVTTCSVCGYSRGQC